MIEIKRLNEVCPSVPEHVWDSLAQDSEGWRATLRSVRTRYWYCRLSERFSELTSAYKMEMFFEPDSFKYDEQGRIVYYRQKWRGYQNGLSMPQRTLLTKVEERAPGSTRDLQHPIWGLLEALLLNDRQILSENFLRQLEPVVQDLLYCSSQSRTPGFNSRRPVTTRVLENLERRASIDSLACLVWLLWEASVKNSQMRVPIGKTLHNVVLMLGVELRGLNVGLELMKFFVDFILPLAVPPNRRICLCPNDYMELSYHLNSLAYLIQPACQYGLNWPMRVKLMHFALKGKFGFDLKLGLAPYFGLDEDRRDLSDEEIQHHELITKSRDIALQSLYTGEGRMMGPFGIPDQ